MIMAAVTLPEPLRFGFCAIIFFAWNAFDSAMGSRMMPKQNRPMIAYFSASPASLQGSARATAMRLRTYAGPSSWKPLHRPKALNDAYA